MARPASSAKTLGTPERAQASREDARLARAKAASAPETRRASRVPLMLARVPGRGAGRADGRSVGPAPAEDYSGRQPGAWKDFGRTRDPGGGPGTRERTGRGAARDEEKCRRFEVVPLFLSCASLNILQALDVTQPRLRHRSPVGTTHLSRARCARERCHRRWRRRASVPPASPLGDVATLADRPAASRASGVAPRSPSPPGCRPRSARPRRRAPGRLPRLAR